MYRPGLKLYKLVNQDRKDFNVKRGLICFESRTNYTNNDIVETLTINLMKLPILRI